MASKLIYNTFLTINMIFFIFDLLKSNHKYYLGANEEVKPVFASSLNTIFATAN